MTDFTINGKPVNVGEISSDLIQVYHRDDTPDEIKKLCTNAHLMIVMMAAKLAKNDLLEEFINDN